jgi:hypothetical protein
MKKIICKNFKNNYVYYSTEADTIFLVEMESRARFSDPHVYDNFYTLYFIDANDNHTSMKLTSAELKYDNFNGIELGEL